MVGRLVIVGLVVVAGGCAGTRVKDYEAGPVANRGEGDARLVGEVGGVRVHAGPPAVFPYSEGEGRRKRVAGRYQLYTRITVENASADSVLVEWSGVRLVEPAGDTVALVMAGSGGAPDGLEVGVPAAAAPVERVAPGRTVTRSLLPATFHEIEVDEPMVSLCEQCEYLLVVPVVVGGRREEVRLGFRMKAVENQERRARFLFWQ